MPYRISSTEFLVGAGIVLITIGVLVGSFYKVKIERDTFNRCTGGDVTFMEAAFTQLRVESCKLS